MKEGKLYQKNDIWYISYDKEEIEVSKCCNNPYDGKCVKFDVEDILSDPTDIDSFKKMAKIIPQIDEIKIGEGCFGPYISIDGIDLSETESSTEEDIKNLNNLKKKLLQELHILLPKMDAYDMRLLAEVIVKRGQWQDISSDSYSDSCEQCGNYNWGETYKR